MPTQPMYIPREKSLLEQLAPQLVQMGAQRSQQKFRAEQQEIAQQFEIEKIQQAQRFRSQPPEIMDIPGVGGGAGTQVIHSPGTGFFKEVGGGAAGKNLTAKIKEFQFAQGQGFKGSFTDYVKTARPQTTISLDPGIRTSKTKQATLESNIKSPAFQSNIIKDLRGSYEFDFDTLPDADKIGKVRTIMNDQILAIRPDAVFEEKVFKKTGKKVLGWWDGDTLIRIAPSAGEEF